MRRALQLGPQAAALDELHHDERLGAAAPVVDATTLGWFRRAAARASRLNRSAEAGVTVVVGTFTATGRSSRSVAGAVHVAHAARPQQHLELVAVGEESPRPAPPAKSTQRRGADSVGCAPRARGARRNT